MRSLQGCARRASSADRPVRRPSVRSSGCTTRVSRLPRAPRPSLPPGRPHGPPGPRSPDTEAAELPCAPLPRPQPPRAGGRAMPSCLRGFSGTLEGGGWALDAVCPSGSSRGRLGAASSAARVQPAGRGTRRQSRARHSDAGTAVSSPHARPPLYCTHSRPSHGHGSLIERRAALDAVGWPFSAPCAGLWGRPQLGADLRALDPRQGPQQHPPASPGALKSGGWATAPLFPGEAVTPGCVAAARGSSPRAV